MPRDPWTTRSTRLVYGTPRFDVHEDQVVQPDGESGQYYWVSLPDQVRVAVILDNKIALVRQFHYLIGSTLQLPGGNIEDDETAERAARRELAQETGMHDGEWTSHGRLCPLPGLTSTYVHLWIVRMAVQGVAEPESTERDLAVEFYSFDQALSAAYNGEIACAASAALIFAVCGPLSQLASE